jgi:hypothetical protein
LCIVIGGTAFPFFLNLTTFIQKGTSLSCFHGVGYLRAHR